MPLTYYVAFWNLENLFDEENSPRRSEKRSGRSAETWKVGRRRFSNERSPNWPRSLAE